MEGCRYYACRVRLGGVVFVVWYSGDRDGFLRDAGGRLLAAETLDELMAAARARGVVLQDAEPADYDFDRIRVWCADPIPSGVDCRVFLDAWNFLDDLAGLHDGVDTPHTRLSRGAARQYHRLFWGSNLPAVTPPGERFGPVWSTDELAEIRSVMASGLGLLEGELGAVGVGPRR